MTSPLHTTTTTSAVLTTAADYAAKQEIPPAALKTDVRAVRPKIVGPEAPEPPYPITLSGLVQKGFGRGGKDLGCPTGLSLLLLLLYSGLIRLHTANLPDESITPLSIKVEMGVYYGYAQIIPPQEYRGEFCQEDLQVLPMVMSLGWNPFYKNKQLTAVSNLSRFEGRRA